jgi:hypothetical protein
VLADRDTATPKTGTGPVEMVRVLKRGKDSAIKARTQAINQIKGLLVSATAELRESVAGLAHHPADRPSRRASSPSPPTDATSAARRTLRLLARRVRRLSEEIRDLEQQLRRLLQAHTPQLLLPMGLGPGSAATLLITAGENPDRLGGEASFAALCGVSPVEAFYAGKTQRRRLNRGGDRQANTALYRIVLTRLRHDPRTRSYLDHRLTSGKTRHEAIRCLKRYVAREVYPLLRSTPDPLTSTGASKRPLERRRRGLLLAVADHGRGVDIDDQHVQIASGDPHRWERHAAGLGVLGPDHFPRSGSCRRHRGESGVVELVKQPPARRVRGHRPEQSLLVGQHRDLGDRGCPVGNRHGQIHQHPARIVRARWRRSLPNASASSPVSAVRSATSASSRDPTYGVDDVSASPCGGRWRRAVRGRRGSTRRSSGYGLHPEQRCV